VVPPSSALPSSVTAPAAAGHAVAAATQRALAEALDRRMARIANGRAVTFLAAVVFTGLAIFERLPAVAWPGAAVSALAYVLLALHHARLLRRERRAQQEAAWHARALARLDGTWPSLASTGERFVDAHHLYTSDLDIFGAGSLFQWLDETSTGAGEERLAAWLRAPATADVIRGRQEAAQELASMADVRRDLAVAGHLARAGRSSPRAFLAWAEGPPRLQSISWARPLAWALPAFTLLTAILSAMGVVPRILPWAGVLLQLLVVALTRRPLGEAWTSFALAEAGGATLGGAFARLERASFHSELLQRLSAGFSPSGLPVSSRMQRFARLLGLAESRRNQLHPVVNLLTLWDVHVFSRLEDWRRQNGALVRQWLEALAEVEALGCLGNVVADHPDFHFPEVDGLKAHLSARGVWHPLLRDAVPNDVELPAPGFLLLVTGSNMSGKSTLLRALGVNAVLALAGGPVAAERLSLSVLHILTSMRVQDSLSAGVSFFHAEVLRLKAVLEAAAAFPGQSLVLLDEILLGTNSGERRVASREVLRLLLEAQALGAVTTHDLALARLEAEHPGSLRAVHFQDHVEAGKMRFDYQLREGVVRTTNALRLMQQAGIPVRAHPPGEGG
jgi:MutS domain V